MQANKPKIIVTIGFALVAFAFTCLFTVAIIATLEGQGGFGVDYRINGRPSFFTPVVYVPLLAGIIAAAVVWVVGRKARKSTEPE